MTEPTPDTQTDLLAAVEALLFVASDATPVARLARALELTKAQADDLLHELEAALLNRGLRLQWTRHGVQLTTAPELSGVVERFLGLETTTRLSQAALEVLSIVAYMQPVTRPQIDQIRGVNSDGALRTLLGKGLVEEIGRMETPGRPILYGTAATFLQQFGLAALDDLPPLDLNLDDDAPSGDAPADETS